MEEVAHTLGVIMKGPFFICIMAVVTPKGRTERMSILSLFSRSKILEQTSTLLLLELQTPTRGERYTPVQEAMLMMALRSFLVRILGTMMRLTRKTASRSILISSTSILGLMVKQDPPATVPALLTTIPMSKSFHSSKMRSRWGISFLSAISHAAYFIQIPLYFSCSSCTFSLQRSSLRLTNSSLNPSSANISANPRPMPCVKPVMTTQQSPYFCLRAGPLRRASLRKWAGTQFHERHALCSHPPTFAVSAATPAIKSTLRRVSSPLLKSSDCVQSDAPCKSGEASKTAFVKRTTGFQSHSTPFNIQIFFYYMSQFQEGEDFRLSLHQYYEFGLIFSQLFKNYTKLRLLWLSPSLSMQKNPLSE